MFLQTDNLCGKILRNFLFVPHNNNFSQLAKDNTRREIVLVREGVVSLFEVDLENLQESDPSKA